MVPPPLVTKIEPLHRRVRNLEHQLSCRAADQNLCLCADFYRRTFQVAALLASLADCLATSVRQRKKPEGKHSLYGLRVV